MGFFPYLLRMNLLQDFAVVLVIAGIAGLLFRRMGLSAIVGYLVAGMIIGPYMLPLLLPSFSLITDVDRVKQLSEFGLVFLLFFVGMELNLNRIRAMGFSLVWATALLTWLVFNFCKLFAGAMGWNEVACFVFASMFVVSSSAIISKMLLENRLGHERYAHNALGITILEDVVVIVLITLLSVKTGISAEIDGHGGIAGNNILGLFAGHAMTERKIDDPWSHFPAAIFLYQKNLERACRSKKELVEQIGITLIHEVGHFLGMSEQELYERGLD